MKTIWKFEFKVQDDIKIEMPIGSEILTVQEQEGQSCLWALVDPDYSTEIRRFDLFGTGHPINENIVTSRKYIGTFQMESGKFVFHLFEKVK